MGQPTHPLMLHAGKAQLWAWGPSVQFGTPLYAIQSRKSVLGMRYVLAFLNGLFIMHSAHPWAPYSWFGGGFLRGRLYRRAQVNLHLPNLVRNGIRRRYFRFTPRKPGFFDGDNFFFESAMDCRWSFFRSYAWGQVHIFRFSCYVIVCVAAVPLQVVRQQVVKRRKRVLARLSRLYLAHSALIPQWF